MEEATSNFVKKYGYDVTSINELKQIVTIHKIFEPFLFIVEKDNGDLIFQRSKLYGKKIQESITMIKKYVSEFRRYKFLTDFFEKFT